MCGGAWYYVILWNHSFRLQSSSPPRSKRGQYVPLMMQENKQITKVRELFPKNNNHVITQSGSMIISPKKITGW